MKTLRPRKAVVRRKATVLLCTCQRCGHEWTVFDAAALLSPQPPRACGKCKTLGWQEAPRWRRPDITAKAGKE